VKKLEMRNKGASRLGGPMEEVIYYLELKNQYYEKFFNVTKRLLDYVHQNRWDILPSFVDTRERIIHIIRSYDFKIARAFSSVDVSQCLLGVYRNRVKELLDGRKTWVDRILVVDLELLSRIDEVKSEGLRDFKRDISKTQLNSDSPFDDEPRMTSPPRKTV
jgi:hypothetical protein